MKSLCRTPCASAARQVTVTVMPTQGLAAMTEAVANDITGYFQRHAVVRAWRAGAAGGCMRIGSMLQLHYLWSARIYRTPCVLWSASGADLS